jgi:DNA-binding response OmpR family regulator
MINERKILVIDDDDDLRQSLEEQLAMSGEFRVVTAETAAKGIELIKNELPDLIVLDLGLPTWMVGKCANTCASTASRSPYLC